MVEGFISSLEDQLEALVAVQVDRLLAAIADDILEFLLRLRGQRHGAGLVEESTIQGDRADAVGAHMARDKEGGHVPLSSMRVKRFARWQDGRVEVVVVVKLQYGIEGWRLWSSLWLGVFEDGCITPLKRYDRRYWYRAL